MINAKPHPLAAAKSSERTVPLSYLDSGAVFSRHPTIEDGVVVGGGAKILGNIIVGKNCRIGAGSVVLRNVPDDSTVVGVPGHIIFREGKRVVITVIRSARLGCNRSS
jgi:serine acetyltransferase